MFPHRSHFRPHSRSRPLRRLALHLALLLGAAGAGFGAAAQTAPNVSAAPDTPIVDSHPLTAELVYRILVGDIALQRGPTSMRPGMRKMRSSRAVPLKLRFSPGNAISLSRPRVCG